MRAPPTPRKRTPAAEPPHERRISAGAEDVAQLLAGDQEDGSGASSPGPLAFIAAVRGGVGARRG